MKLIVIWSIQAFERHRWARGQGSLEGQRTGQPRRTEDRAASEDRGQGSLGGQRTAKCKMQKWVIACEAGQPLFLETCWFTEPPAIALLNCWTFKRSCIICGFYFLFQNCFFFAGFFSEYSAMLKWTGWGACSAPFCVLKSLKNRCTQRLHGLRARTKGRSPVVVYMKLLAWMRRPDANLGFVISCILCTVCVSYALFISLCPLISKFINESYALFISLCLLISKFIRWCFIE
jgi:hypothetical protein